MSTAISVTCCAADSLRRRIRLLNSASLICAAACCPPAPSPPPPPFQAPMPIVTPLPLVVPLLFGWLLHFPLPQPLPLVASPSSALASTRHLSLRHALCLDLSLCLSCFVGCRFSWRLAPPSRHNSALCCLSWHPSCLVSLLHCPVPWPINRWLLHCLSSRHRLLCVYASCLGQCLALSAATPTPVSVP